MKLNECLTSGCIAMPLGYKSDGNQAGYGLSKQREVVKERKKKPKVIKDDIDSQSKDKGYMGISKKRQSNTTDSVFFKSPTVKRWWDSFAAKVDHDSRLLGDYRGKGY